MIGSIVLEKRVVQQAGKAEEVKLDRLETPVLRWDANWLAPERLEKIGAKVAS